MSPLEQLGLPADADERMVKRAYAQRLRDTRPDSDPEGFQHLHAIYQAALAQCQRQAPGTAMVREAPGEPSTPADGTPVAVDSPPDETIAIAFGPFCDQLFELGAKGDATSLKAWLEGLPALWSLRMKARVGQELLAQLHREAPPMSPACMEALLAFFDMDQARPGHDALRLQQLLRRMQLAWELQPAHRDALAERMGLPLHSGRGGLDLHLERLARPFGWAQVVRIGLVPYEASAYTQFIQDLGLRHPEDLPGTCDPDQVRFWLKATEPGRVSKARLQLGGIRCAAALLGGLVLGWLFGIVMRTPPDPFYWPAFGWCVGLSAVPCALWGLSMLMLPLDSWHAKPEYQPVRWPWLNLLLVPLLCAATLASAEAEAYVPALGCALLALWLAFRRLRRRNATSLRLNPRLIWFGLWGLFMLARSFLQDTDPTYASSAYPALAAATAMLIWGMDLWRQRHGLRVRAEMTR